VIKKEVIDKVGGYPTEYFLYRNELALGAAIIHAGYEINYVPALIAYRKVAETRKPGARYYYYMTRNGCLSSGSRARPKRKYTGR